MSTFALCSSASQPVCDALLVGMALALRRVPSCLPDTIFADRHSHLIRDTSIPIGLLVNLLLPLVEPSASVPGSEAVY